MQKEQFNHAPDMNLLKETVLAATDPLHLPPYNTMATARRLIRQASHVHGIIDAMIERDECYFEAVQLHSPAYLTAVQHALELIPLLAAAGDCPTPHALDSARYNCDPLIQQALLAALPTAPQ